MKVDTNPSNINYKPLLTAHISGRPVSPSAELINPITHEITTFGERELIKALDKVSKDLESSNLSLQYTIHKDTGTIMVKIIKSESNELVREIPPEKILDMVAVIWDMAGIMIDKKI